MKRYEAEINATGLAFPEGPRWHNNRLWFTDQHARRIYAMQTSGALQTVAHTPDLPGGLGWLPDGTLLVVYMTQRQIMLLSGTALRPYADLSQHARFHCNDMVVDAVGRVYAGNFGFDLHGGEAMHTTEIVLVDSDGTIEPFATDLVFPNGSVITSDGRQLLVAETFAHRITAFDLTSDGRLQSRWVWAELDEATPDGICLDREGALWVASPGSGELIRVKQGGAILARCTTRGTPYACMLGGYGRRTLFVCSAETDDPDQAAQRKSGRIEQVEVAVPGTGRP
jgi:sugar lactone lactonase YvrE